MKKEEPAARLVGRWRCHPEFQGTSPRATSGPPPGRPPAVPARPVRPPSAPVQCWRPAPRRRAPATTRGPSAGTRRRRTRPLPAPATATARPPCGCRGTPRPARDRRSTRGRRNRRAPTARGGHRSRAARWRPKPVSTTPRPIRRPPTRRRSRAGHPAGSRRRATAARPPPDTRLLPRRAAGPALPCAPASRRRRRAPSAACCRAPTSGRPPHERLPLAASLCGTARRRRGTGKRASLRTPRRDTAPITGPHPTGAASARDARPAGPASRSSSSPTRRGADRP